MNELKKADEIVRALKECGDCDTCPYYDCWIDEHTGGLADACDEGRLFRDVIALIESLQAQLKLEHGGALATAENCLRLQGEVNDLQAQLSASRRREKAAVEDLYRISPCDTCKHYDADNNTCARPDVHYDECFEWRGPVAVEGDAE